MEHFREISLHKQLLCSHHPGKTQKPWWTPHTPKRNNHHLETLRPKRNIFEILTPNISLIVYASLFRRPRELKMDAYSKVWTDGVWCTLDSALDRVWWTLGRVWYTCAMEGAVQPRPRVVYPRPRVVNAMWSQMVPACPGIPRSSRIDQNEYQKETSWTKTKLKGTQQEITDYSRLLGINFGSTFH